MPDAPAADAAKKPRPSRPEQLRSASLQTTIGGRTLPITATAGTITLKNERDEERASIFFVSYTRDGVEDPSQRPVTFCFNGGPGSSSVWLHLGAFGPRRVDLPDAEHPKAPPCRVVDNAHGLLDLTDLVFIDPVGTGWSRLVGESEGKDYWGVKEDVESVATFIQRWLSRNNRWSSPRFLAGESYGTTRAAGLARHLQDAGVGLNGLVLVSVALNFQTFVFETGNDLPNLLFLPTYAATAWYHDRLPSKPPALAPFLDEVRAFALDVYAPALFRGASLDPETRRRVARRLARYTGMKVEEILARNLRIDSMWFAKQLLGAPGRGVGRLDSRYVGDDVERDAPTLLRDASYEAMQGPYAAAVNDLLRRVFGWQSDDDYEIIANVVNEGWKWQHGKRLGYVNVAEDLQAAMTANPHLKVILMSGLYDLATPFFATEHTANHLEIAPKIRENLRLTSYDAGHMMYVHPPSLVQMKEDLAAFYGDACSAR